ncbi:hypothetical protein BOX15_Mlig000113g3 [Macrostomum lignano]|uniref:Rho-GAP domain-containing protein n=1 Tax=Macrostomum lignano TaxID=282301 RepID=A0A267GLN0_9PLAT|nr:hypothetical protein BOX15_Mlig000113g3 [Macrostomum lignano]
MEPAQEQPQQLTKSCEQGDNAGEASQRDSRCLDMVLERLQTELDGLRVHAGYCTLPAKSNSGPLGSGSTGGGGGGGGRSSGGWADDSDLMENIAELDQLLLQPAPPASSASSSSVAVASKTAASDEESAMATALLESMSPFDGEPRHSDSDQQEEQQEENGSAGGLKRGTKFRWSSFARSHRPNVNQRELQISGMSVTQLRVLRNAACEEINKIVRQHCPPNKPLFTWSNQKPAKRSKSSASPNASPSIVPLGQSLPASPSSAPTAAKTAVFGMPLFTVQMRYGQPLPSAVIHLMRQLRQSGVSAHGIFRRAGGKARVSALRAEIDADPDKSDFSRCQPYDLADLVKAYLRELPECLITHKLSPTLLAIFSHVETDSVLLAAVQAAALLLPDENRQVLQALLYFLNDFADCSDTTQMTPSNLAVCLAPSLFYFPHQVAAATPSRFRRPGGGAPDPRDLEDHKAAAACLAFMIDCCHRMFTVPDELYRRLAESRSEELQVPILDAVAPLDSIGRRHCFAFVENHAQLVARETCQNEKWVPFSHRSGIETFFKVVDDGHPLRLWKALVLIEADSTDVLNRIVTESESWDPDVLKSETLESLDEASDVVRRTLASPPAQPSRETCLLRAWRSASAHSHSLYSTSVRLPTSPLTLSALVLVEDWLVQSAGPGATRVTLLSRVDLRGHSIEWYGSTWGHAVARRLVHLKKSFQRKARPTGAL